MNSARDDAQTLRTQARRIGDVLERLDEARSALAGWDGFGFRAFVLWQSELAALSSRGAGIKDRITTQGATVLLLARGRPSPPRFGQHLETTAEQIRQWCHDVQMKLCDIAGTLANIPAQRLEWIEHEANETIDQRINPALLDLVAQSIRKPGKAREPLEENGPPSGVGLSSAP